MRNKSSHRKAYGLGIHRGFIAGMFVMMLFAISFFYLAPPDMFEENNTNLTALL